jgi:hypothetical protein
MEISIIGQFSSLVIFFYLCYIYGEVILLLYLVDKGQ